MIVLYRDLYEIWVEYQVVPHAMFQAKKGIGVWLEFTAKYLSIFHHLKTFENARKNENFRLSSDFLPKNWLVIFSDEGILMKSDISWFFTGITDFNLDFYKLNP